jgi:hypothetical protein
MLCQKFTISEGILQTGRYIFRYLGTYISDVSLKDTIFLNS